jgi:hypothetical protein
MKHILALHIFASFGLLTGTIAAHGQPVRVYSDGGSIFIERGGGTTKLTGTEMDIDPVLSPNGSLSSTPDRAAAAAVGITSPTSSAPPSHGLTSYGASTPTAAMTGCS